MLAHTIGGHIAQMLVKYQQSDRQVSSTPNRPKAWINVYVAVKFLSQVIFIFLLFLGMVMYANEVETKEK